MEIVLKSLLLVAAAEMGDKTQLLAFVLASRFKKPWAILGGILTATVANHLLASALGTWFSVLVPRQIMSWVLGLTFILFAGWILIPDKDEKKSAHSGRGAFFTTVITFFLAEMGDKTQLATVALAARYGNIFLVTLGTTLGMLLSDGLAVVFGESLTRRIPMKWVRVFAALLFMIFGIAVIFPPRIL